MATPDSRRITPPEPEGTAEADPADVAEQQVAIVDDEEMVLAETVEQVGEANPVDVYEQAMPVTSDDEAWARE